VDSLTSRAGLTKALARRNERHEPVDFLETELQPGVEEYLFVFREDRLGT